MARLSSQVAARRAHVEPPFVADLHGARFRAPGLADVPDAGAGDRHHPCLARFAVVGGDRRGAAEGLAVGVDAGWALEDDVAAGHPTHVELPIVGPGYTEAQII